MGSRYVMLAPVVLGLAAGAIVWHNRGPEPSGVGSAPTVQSGPLGHAPARTPPPTVSASAGATNAASASPQAESETEVTAAWLEQLRARSTDEEFERALQTLLARYRGDDTGPGFRSRSLLVRAFGLLADKARAEWLILEAIRQETSASGGRVAFHAATALAVNVWKGDVEKGVDRAAERLSYEPSSRIREALCGAIRSSGSPRAANILFDTYLREPDIEVRKDILANFGGIGDPALTLTLTEPALARASLDDGLWTDDESLANAALLTLRALARRAPDERETVVAQLVSFLERPTLDPRLARTAAAQLVSIAPSQAAVLADRIATVHPSRARSLGGYIADPARLERAVPDKRLDSPTRPPP